MKIGFGKHDITPRIGVELCGFGPFLNRRAIGVRERLWARAVAFRQAETTLVLVSCDLVGVDRATTRQVRRWVREATGLPDEAVMVHCTHTHSGPATVPLHGWSHLDQPYVEVLPRRIASACIEAVGHLSEATLKHAAVPCEGIGLNREYDQDAPPLEEVLREDWRPAKPELTDTICQVFTVETQGRLAGFLSYFGCHPVVCCQETRYIHGDYAGVATGLLERENPGAVGLFLQGAQGDVNSCVVHKPEREALLALDVIAARYANRVRVGLAQAQPLEVGELRCALHEVDFPRKDLKVETLREWLSEREAILQAPGASDEDGEVRMATVYAMTLRNLIAKHEAGLPLGELTELQGFRLGEVTLLGTPFEVFQAIKNEVSARARSKTALVMGLTNDLQGYAPDRTAAERGGYAADVVPMIRGAMPFRSLHDHLVEKLIALEGALYV